MYPGGLVTSGRQFRSIGTMAKGGKINVSIAKDREISIFSPTAIRRKKKDHARTTKINHTINITI
jgi:hypothetical protein